MRSTMQDFPLTTTMLLQHGRALYSDSRVLTFAPTGAREATYEQVAQRAELLAAALTRLGVNQGDVVGTFAWNTQEHLEAYFAIPGMGAVLHTLNLRLFPDQLVYVTNHAEDRVVIVDDSIIPLIARVAADLKTVEHYIVVGNGDASALSSSTAQVHRYEELLAAEKPGFAWPTLDERSAAAMCYTTGTTGEPKGVVYSHRSTTLHAFGAGLGPVIPLTEHDTILPIVPMFHAMAWGLPYGGWAVGSDFLMPERYLQAEPLVKMIEAYKPTYAAAIPTIWNDVLRYTDANPSDLSSLRLVTCGGSAVPRVLMERFQEKFGITILQGWGMTETSPLAAIARPPMDLQGKSEMDWRAKTGRIVAGVELRIVDDEGVVQPRDGESVGEIQVRGPWITASYHLDDAPEKFHDGWLRTGDVGTVDAKGYIQITDRAKDVIKSGGEWISSVEVENTLMAHPEIVEAAVVGIPDPKWDERPLACIVRTEGSTVTPEALREFLTGKIAKWALPERWTFIAEIPKTSVGKFDKKVLRAKHSEGALEVETVGGATR